MYRQNQIEESKFLNKKKRPAERLASVNKPVGSKIPQIGQSKKKAPPGILGKMPPHEIESSSIANESRDSIDSSSMNSKGPRMEAPVDSSLKKDKLISRHQGFRENVEVKDSSTNNQKNRSHMRKRWERPSRDNTGQGSNESRFLSAPKQSDASMEDDAKPEENTLAKQQREMKERRLERFQARKKKESEEETQAVQQNAQDIFKRTLDCHSRDPSAPGFRRQPEHSAELNQRNTNESSGLFNQRENTGFQPISRNTNVNNDQDSANGINLGRINNFSGKGNLRETSNNKIPTNGHNNESSIRNRFPARISRKRTNNDQNDDRNKESKSRVNRILPSRTIGESNPNIYDPKRENKEVNSEPKENGPESGNQYKIPRPRPRRGFRSNNSPSKCSKIIGQITPALVLIAVILVLSGSIKLFELGYYKFLQQDNTIY